MIATRKQTRRQISDLKMDLEVINPIESKTLLGGDWYHLDTVYVTAWSGGGYSYGADYQQTSGMYDYGGDWNNDGGNYGYVYGGGDGGYGVPNLPSTVEQQLGSMGACVSYAMSFISGVLGHSISGPMMAVHNANALNLNLTTTMVEGLTPAQATQAIQAYFNTNTLSTIAQVNTALDAGHGVLGNYNGHEVVIVNYNDDVYTVADSNTGTYHAVQQSQVDFNNGVYEVLSVKP